jgi:hypothetical protein
MTLDEATRQKAKDELREVALDVWRSRWEEEHTPEELDEAINGDSSAGGHPYWTEPYTDQEYERLLDAVVGALAGAGDGRD